MKKSEIKVIMDEYIKAHLPKEMLNNNFEALDINNQKKNNNKSKIFPDKGIEGGDLTEEKWLNRINTPDQSAIHNTAEMPGLNIAKGRTLNLRKRGSIFSRESKRSNDNEEDKKNLKIKKKAKKYGSKLKKENTNDGKSKIDEI